MLKSGAVSVCTIITMTKKQMKRLTGWVGLELAGVRVCL